MPFTSTALVVGPTALEAATAAMLLRRGLHRELPVFFSYLIYQCLWASTLLFLMGKPRYAVAYWLGDMMSMALDFAVIHELFASLLKDYPRIKKLGWAFYKVAAVTLMGIAVISLALTSHHTMRLLLDVLLMMERGIRIMQCGQLSFVLLFSYCLGLSWRNHAFGFALGFAIFVMTELVVVAARWHDGAVGQDMYFWLKPLSFDLATVIWAGYAFQSGREIRSDFSLSGSRLEQWNDSVLQLLRRQWN